MGLGPTMIWVRWVGREETEANVKDMGEVVVMVVVDVVVNTRSVIKKKGIREEKEK